MVPIKELELDHNSPLLLETIGASAHRYKSHDDNVTTQVWLCSGFMPVSSSKSNRRHSGYWLPTMRVLADYHRAAQNCPPRSSRLPLLDLLRQVLAKVFHDAIGLTLDDALAELA